MTNSPIASARSFLDAEPEGRHKRLAAERVPRLIARLYAGSSTALRARLLECLLRPLGPLGLAAVASGVFLSHLLQAREAGLRVAIESTVRYSAAQVFELARFAEQVDPAVLQQLGALLADAPLGSAGLSAAALLVFVRRRAQRRTE